MKVRLSIDVGDYERYVIARYFRPTDKTKRGRATRAQVKRFVDAALRTCVRDQAADALDKRAKAVARRLQNGVSLETAGAAAEFLDVRERQRTLW